MTEASVVKAFLEHGLMGVVCLVCLYACYRFYRDMKDTQKQLSDAQNAIVKNNDELSEKHKLEMKALMDRYITKAESWMEKYHEQSKELIQVTELLERRWGRD